MICSFFSMVLCLCDSMSRLQSVVLVDVWLLYGVCRIVSWQSWGWQLTDSETRQHYSYLRHTVALLLLLPLLQVCLFVCLSTSPQSLADVAYCLVISVMTYKFLEQWFDNSQGIISLSLITIVCLNILSMKIKYLYLYSYLRLAVLDTSPAASKTGLINIPINCVAA